MEEKYCPSCMNILQGDVCTVCGGQNAVNRPGQLKCGTYLADRYLIGKCIGQGGFGITYIGRDLKLDKKVAVKEYYPMSFVRRSSELSENVETIAADQSAFFAEGKSKFLQEARLLARYNDDPNIVYVNDFFEANHTAYFVMEYLKGKSLSEILKDEGPMSIDSVLSLLSPMIDTLEKLHGSGLLHRDISPSNIMLTESGRVKLLDFGSARQVGQNNGNLTVFSKAGYSPAEQYSEGGEQGPWSDVYSLCATIYKLITGITPESSLMRAYNETLKKPSDLGVSISLQQENALMHGLCVNHQARTRSMAQLKAELFAPEIDEEATVVSPRNRPSAPVYPGNSAGSPVSQPAPQMTNVPPVKQNNPVPAYTAPATPLPVKENTPVYSSPASPVNKEDPAYDAPSNKKSGKKEKASKSGKKKKLWLIPVIAGAAVIVLIMLFFPIFTGTKASPYFSQETVTAKDIRAIRNQKKSTWVTMTDCEISNEVLKALSGCKYVKHVEIVRCTGYTDLYVLGYMKNLEYLKIEGDEATGTDISLLLGSEVAPDFEKVDELIIQGEGLTSADFLKHFPALTELTISYCAGSPDNIEGLASRPLLTSLSITNWDLSASDYSIISDLSDVTSITLIGCGLSDVSWMSTMEKLLTVQLSNNNISDISPLAELPRLNFLNVNNNPVNDFSPISKMAKLRSLFVDETGLSSLDFCLTLYDLDMLSAARNSLTSLDGLENCCVLRYVNFNDNDLEDVSLLSKCKSSLNIVRLNNNRISDLSWLEGASVIMLSASGNLLTDLHGLESSTNLVTLSVFNNSITDISALEGHSAIMNLDLGENQIEDISVLECMTKFEYLILQNNRISDMSYINIPERGYAEIVSLYGNENNDSCSVYTNYFAARKLFVEYSDDLDIRTILSNAYIIYLINVPSDRIGSFDEIPILKTKLESGIFFYYSFEDADAEITARRAEIEEEYSSDT